jgi:hypothetical protein
MLGAVAEYRILLARFPDADRARVAAELLAGALAQHFAFLAAPRRARHRDALTPPLHDLARAEGFAWSDDDAFGFDDVHATPDLQIRNAERLLIVFHPACTRFAQSGIAAFSRARGATAIAVFDPDPSASIVVTLRTKAARSWFDREFAATCDRHHLELELSTTDPGGEVARLIVDAPGQRRRYAPLETWGLGDVLLALGARPGVELDLELAANDRPGEGDAPRALALPVQHALETYLIAIVEGARRAGLAEAIAAEALAFAHRASAGAVTQAVIDARLASRDGAEAPAPPLVLDAKLARAAAAYDRLGWKLAVARPITQRELAMEAARHARWISHERGAHAAPARFTWSELVAPGGISIAVSNVFYGSHASYAWRDARGRSFEDRPLRGASFVGALVDRAQLARADLRQACARDLSARDASFIGANLEDIDLSRADLRGASFRDANLRGANLDGADLAGCDFTGAARSP